MKKITGNQLGKAFLAFCLASGFILMLATGNVWAQTKKEKSPELKHKPFRMNTLSVIGPLFNPMVFKFHKTKKAK